MALSEISRETASGRAPIALKFDTTEDGQARLAVNRALRTHDYSPARALAHSALSLNAYNTNARLRLAYIDFREHGRLTAQGERDLAQSYDLAPYDPFAASWRVKFALDHWGDLSPATRKAAHAEALAFLQVGSQVANMRNTLSSIRSGEGQLIAALWLIEAG
ncbi:hypothetical protein [Phenylobacterium aquaticum]|uniref:hypothetical protein n=1 Tax=Phenylobacterium aquaticum TaxID=1763816 RepID=UPI001F5C6861|nr:hypothetical protein [Phenylobacterium aquaticum]MCI3132725.1 hypothetical protein [Phenylobacterium aquaticum]